MILFLLTSFLYKIQKSLLHCIKKLFGGGSGIALRVVAWAVVVVFLCGIVACRFCIVRSFREFVGTYSYYIFQKIVEQNHFESMTCFFEKPLKKPSDIKIRFFTPPSDGMNHPFDGKDPYKAESGPWLTDYYTEIKSLPRLRFEEEPVLMLKKYTK